MKHVCRTADRDVCETSMPSTLIVPERGSKSRRRARMKVLLPLKFTIIQRDSVCPLESGLLTCPFFRRV